PGGVQLLLGHVPGVRPRLPAADHPGRPRRRGRRDAGVARQAAQVRDPRRLHRRRDPHPARRDQPDHDVGAALLPVRALDLGLACRRAQPGGRADPPPGLERTRELMAERGVAAVLLDMGGVLLPEQQTYERAARDPALLAALAAQGVPEPERYVVERASRLREEYRALEKECRQPDLDVVFADSPPAVRGRLLGAFQRQSSPPPYVFAGPVVADLARRYKLGLISNNSMPGDHHARVLRRCGILQHFGCAVWSGNFGRRKPDPAMIEHALRVLR